MDFSDLRTGSGPGVSVIEEFECNVYCGEYIVLVFPGGYVTSTICVTVRTVTIVNSVQVCHICLSLNINKMADVISVHIHILE